MDYGMAVLAAAIIQLGYAVAALRLARATVARVDNHEERIVVLEGGKRAA